MQLGRSTRISQFLVLKRVRLNRVPQKPLDFTLQIYCNECSTLLLITECGSSDQADRKIITLL